MIVATCRIAVCRASAQRAPTSFASAARFGRPLAAVVATGSEEVVVVGRVCCEGEGKLNLQSIFLEGSRASSNACRVRLDLSACPEFALFPGQAVAVRALACPP